MALLGVAQEATKDIDGARGSFVKRLSWHTENADIWSNRGRLEWNQGAYVAAVDCFEKVTRLQPEIATGWHLLGKAQEATKDIDGAKGSYRKGD